MQVGALVNWLDNIIRGLESLIHAIMATPHDNSSVIRISSSSDVNTESRV